MQIGWITFSTSMTLHCDGTDGTSFMWEPPILDSVFFISLFSISLNIFNIVWSVFFSLQKSLVQWFSREIGFSTYSYFFRHSVKGLMFHLDQRTYTIVKDAHIFSITIQTWAPQQHRVALYEAPPTPPDRSHTLLQRCLQFSDTFNWYANSEMEKESSKHRDIFWLFYCRTVQRLSITVHKIRNTGFISINLILTFSFLNAALHAYR